MLSEDTIIEFGLTLQEANGASIHKFDHISQNKKRIGARAKINTLNKKDSLLLTS